MSDYAAIEKEARIFTEECVTNNRIDPTLFAQYDIKRGLRDKNGKGVLAGITNISRIDAFEERDGQKVPCEGKLWYRGYNVYDLIRGLRGKRYAFEGAAYLLLLGDLPNKEQLESFTACLAKCRDLPTNFVRDVIMKAPSHDLMNSLTRSVLTLASYDDDIGKTDLQTQLEQCIKLISVFPMLAVYGYHAYNYYECGGSMYIHRPDPSLSTAENLLKMLRPDQKYTDLEAHVLDIALLLHMEHGGGNNSTFTTRVVTSSGSDTYSVIAAALSSLKGPKHGGANIKVMQMMDDIRAHVADPLDEEAMADYLGRIVDRQAFDQKGLIYGMGHAVYSLSDPRAVVFKSFVHQLADAKGRSRDFEYYNTIERLAPQVIAEKRHIYKGVSTNVDFYSGFVYDMLGIPVELYTPRLRVSSAGPPTAWRSLSTWIRSSARPTRASCKPGSMCRWRRDKREKERRIFAQGEGSSLFLVIKPPFEAALQGRVLPPSAGRRGRRPLQQVTRIRPKPPSVLPRCSPARHCNKGYPYRDGNRLGTKCRPAQSRLWTGCRASSSGCWYSGGSARCCRWPWGSFHIATSTRHFFANTNPLPSPWAHPQDRQLP